MQWLRQVHPTTAWTTSACTGSIYLAAAGILDGQDASTHWARAGQLERRGARYTEQRVAERRKGDHLRGRIGRHRHGPHPARPRPWPATCADGPARHRIRPPPALRRWITVQGTGPDGGLRAIIAHHAVLPVPPGGLWGAHADAAGKRPRKHEQRPRPQPSGAATDQKELIMEATQPAHPAQPPPTAPARSRNGLGVAALVIGVASLVAAISFLLFPLGLVGGLVGLVIAIIALTRGRHRGATNSGQAIAGLVCSVLALIVAIGLSVQLGTWAARNTGVFTRFDNCIAHAGNRGEVSACIARFADEVRQ